MDAGECLVMGCSMLIIASALFVIGTFLGNTVLPFLSFVGGLFWAAIILAILVIGLLWRAWISANLSNRILAVGTIGLIGLISVLIFIGAVDNPAYTLNKFCKAVPQAYSPGAVGGEQAVYNELTPRGQDEWVSLVQSYPYLTYCVYGPVYGNTAGMSLFVRSSDSESHYRVALVQGDWGVWKIDHFQRE